MKKVLLCLLISVSGLLQARRSAHNQAQSHNHNQAVNQTSPKCFEVEINKERLKLTWLTWLNGLIGWQDRNRLTTEGDIHGLQKLQCYAQAAEIDRRHHVYQEWKNSAIATIHGLKYPAIVAFLCFAYANSPAHDGTIPGKIKSGAIGSITTGLQVGKAAYSTSSYIATQIGWATASSLHFVGNSIDAYLRHQYSTADAVQKIAHIAPEVVASVVGQPGHGIA